MALIESVIEKTFQDGTKYWLAIIDGKEVPCYDATIKDHKGKENPFQIALSQKGKEYLKVPKAGGFKSGGGGWKGKSELEIKAQVLTMSMAYSKDIMVAYFEKLPDSNSVFDLVVEGYRKISGAILADLAKIQPEAPKTADKPPQSVPQETSPEKPKEVQPELENKGTLSAKDNLKAKMKAYLKARNADTPNAFKALLVELTEFPGKNRETGELTGKMVFIDDIDDKKFSDKWALTSYGKLKALIEQEEQRGANDMDDSDIRY
jgi:hypothetical protein